MKPKLPFLKLVLLLLTLVGTVSPTFAYDFVSSGIYYNKLSSGTVEVTFKDDSYNSYSGKVTIPETVSNGGTNYKVTRIGPQAFRQCSNLTSVNIPNSVTYISYYVFAHCSKLENIVIPSSVTYLGPNLFYACTGLKKIILGHGIKRIDAYLLRNGTGNSVTTIICLAATPPTCDDEIDFDGTGYSKITLYVPTASVSAYKSADYWRRFANIQPANTDFLVDGVYYQKTSNNTVEVRCESDNNYNSYSGSVTVPSKIRVNGVNYEVTAVGNSAFRGCNDLSSVTLPKTIKRIGIAAFEEASLTSVDVPDAVETIEEGAFYGCSKLKIVRLGYGLKNLKSTAFKNCSALTTLRCIAMTPPKMANSALFDASAYNNATLYVPRAALNAYKGADWWRMFNSINELPFDFCVNGIYYNITGSNTVEVTFRDEDYFSYSGTVIVPSTVAYGGKNYDVTGVGNAAFGMCPQLDAVTLPNTVTYIGEAAFSWTTITGMTIPNSVETIGQQAFALCAIQSITLGSGLTSIGDKAFTLCGSLTEVASLATTPPTMEAKTCFDEDLYSSVTLSVPRNSLSAYKGADWWRMFMTIEGIDTGSNPYDVNEDGEVSIADLNVLIAAILSNKTDSKFDLNGDHEVSLADLNVLINAVLNN